MGLIQVATATVDTSGGAVNDVQLIGTTEDAVYLMTATGIKIASDGTYLQTRVVKAGTTQSATNYKDAAKVLRSNSGFDNYFNSGTPRSELYFCGAQPQGNDHGETSGCYWWLYNFNSSSQYSFIMGQDYQTQYTGTAVGGNAGGTCYAVAEAHNGISISGYATNFNDGGRFTLYKVVN